MLVAAVKVMADLVKLGWAIRVSKSNVEIRRPVSASGVQEEIRESARRQHQSQRDDQLRQTPVREFIRQMETRKPFANQFVSIFSLMRDGEELARLLRQAGSLANSDRRTEEIGQLVKPYLQFVRGEETCPHTGLRLVDICAISVIPGPAPQERARPDDDDSGPRCGCPSPSRYRHCSFE